MARSKATSAYETHDPYDVITLVWDWLYLRGHHITLTPIELAQARRPAEDLLRVFGIQPETPPATD